MKRIVLITAILALVAAGGAMAQTVVGTAHDLSSTGPGATTDVNRVCVFCHTPHQATAANAQDPLWNHTLSATAAYGVYDSATLDATPADIGGAAAGSASTSALCMSCHDGTVSVASLYNDPNELGGASPTLTAGGNVDAAGLITGNPNLGTDLTDDHPINFTYDTALATTDGELVDPAGAPTVQDLLIGGMVQCSSCHDPHDNTFVPFMTVDNTNSALCTTCHIK